jgi:Gram-negative bacterial TonB protein C-terminal
MLQIGVRPDGTVASAEVISGHPILKQAALDSARKSTFLRQEGTGGTASYLLTYTFGLRTDPNGGCSADGTFVRAAKCLYLWKCQWHNAPPIASPVGELPGRVIILAPPTCVETETSHLVSRLHHLE